MVCEIERRNYSAWTKRTYRAVIRIFFKWLRGTEELPDEVRWIKLNRIRNSLSPGDLLTKEGVKKMIETAANLRDKALIAVLYDSACRPHEVLTLRLKDVMFDANGALLTVNGKTGQRTVRIIGAASILTTWSTCTLQSPTGMLHCFRAWFATGMSSWDTTRSRES
jgi:integrase/recombinase XerD